jgi:hypothetical protein
MEREPHNPSGSRINKLTSGEVSRRGFLGAVAAFATAAGLAACGGNTEANPPSTPAPETGRSMPTSEAPILRETATPTPEAKPTFTYAELNSNLREWVDLDDLATRLSAASGEEARRKILYEFFGNKSNNGGLPYPELSGPKNARCTIERNAEVVERATTELATVAALLADTSVSEETKKVVLDHYCELFMKPNSEEDPKKALLDMVSKLKVKKERCNLFNMSGGKTESNDSPIPELPAIVAISSEEHGDCIVKRREGNSASSNMLQIAFVPKSLKPTVDSGGNITGYEIDEESAAKSPVCIIEMVPMASDKSSGFSSSSLIFGLSNIVPESSQTTMKVDGVEKPISSLRAK